MKAYITISTGDIHGPEGSSIEHNQYLIDSNQDDVLDALYLISGVFTQVYPATMNNKVEMLLDLIVKNAVTGVTTSKNEAIKNGQPWSKNDGYLELVIGFDSDDEVVDIELVNPGMIQHKRIEGIMNIIAGHYGKQTRGTF
jgi:hypothetical protein